MVVVVVGQTTADDDVAFFFVEHTPGALACQCIQLWFLRLTARCAHPAHAESGKVPSLDL